MAERTTTDEGKVGRAEIGEKPEATRLNCSSTTRDSCGKVLSLMVQCIDAPCREVVPMMCEIIDMNDEEETSRCVLGALELVGDALSTCARTVLSLHPPVDLQFWRVHVLVLVLLFSQFISVLRITCMSPSLNVAYLVKALQWPPVRALQCELCRGQCRSAS